MRRASIVAAAGLLAVVSLPAIALAQNSAAQPEPPGVEVLKSSWSKERIGWERDPFAGPVENYDEMRVRMRNERRIQEAKKTGSPMEVDKITREAKADDANIELIRQKAPPRYVFMYKASVRNTGAKTIKAIDWDYVFYEPDTEHEVERRQFTSDAKIAPGKTKGLEVLIATPPTRTVSVYALGKDEQRSVRGRVVIVRVEYADGSSGRSPSTL
ncbi:MAG TPA: hypothetical protein VN256_25345 [Pyrinomonadaceae bacterium]|nr:hypothetical protein [Pyrinomonadaceae bacterium]